MYLKSLRSPDFIHVVITLNRTVSYLRAPIVKLQGRSEDLIWYQCHHVLHQLAENIRRNVDSYAQRIFQHSCHLAEKAGVEMTKPRGTQRQQHRMNAPCETAEEFFKVTITIPLFDHIIADLEARFSCHVKRSSRITSALPAALSAATQLTQLKR